MRNKHEQLSDIERVAREKLGFAGLRPGQEEAIRSLLDGRDTLLVQPTGSGKSAVYQIAGLMIKGATLVVSPLIALQKDQVESIADQDNAGVAAINSAQKTQETRDAFEKLKEGELEYLLMSPEQLRKPETVQKLKEADISLFVVDEAHCVSEWGHDFRPDYLSLGSVIEQLGHPVVLAMTATASPSVRDEIIVRLGLREPNVLVHAFDRPNISLRVDHFETEDEKFEALIHRVEWADKPGIVYAATRKNAEATMRALKERGVKALYYHAGLKARERNEIQEQFMDGEAEVIVATNAFGMGIDKENVRFVYHFDITDSIDSYYQEIGRAGRDGKPAEAILFYRRQNLALRKFQAGGGKLNTDVLEQIVEAIRDEEGAADVGAIAGKTDLSERKVISALHRLEDAGAVESSEPGSFEVVEDRDLAEVTGAAAEREQVYREEKRRRVEQMQQYAETSECRRAFILRYFGDESEVSCGNCDNCQPSRAEAGAGTRREVSA